MKEEALECSKSISKNRRSEPLEPVSVVDLSSSSDSDDSCSSEDDDVPSKKKKKRRLDSEGVVLPAGFLDPLPSKVASLPVAEGSANAMDMTTVQSCKQFWKSGDFQGRTGGDWDTSSGGMDHVRIHPRFLHSNATSHKWVLGAFAELLDNSLDEVSKGATYVNIDMVKSKKDGSRMLLIEDNGGGMNPDEMRQCMSLGYSLKSQVADTIGQYGNGFKTSTMRLGADVIVFSRCARKDGQRPTQSIGLLSYTFLRSTGQEDIVVPMLDYKRGPHQWHKMIRSSAGDWEKNVETIVRWSPFSSEADLLGQFNQMKEQGTWMIIYNLWEDDQGLLELDFGSDQHDIQIRGVSRDEKSIQMAKQFPNSRHFLTYRHSLRSYASILYLRIPPGFRIILRGKDVEHHNIVNDMMMTQEVTYRPQHGVDGVPKDSNIVAVVTVGFVKDAKSHIDVQGFNVYHKNRLIKPFWRLWNSAGSDGRGVIGVLEANFVEPAHDKQGFERTIVLSRLEGRLIQMQKTYWRSYCQKIGYAPRRNATDIERGKESGEGQSSLELSSPVEGISDADLQTAAPERQANANSHEASSAKNPTRKHGSHTFGQTIPAQSKAVDVSGNEFFPLSCSSHILNQLREENAELLERVKKREEKILGDLLRDLQKERDRCKSLEAQLEEARRKIEELNQEQESLIDEFSKERDCRDKEEEMLRNKLKDASNTVQELQDKVRLLEKRRHYAEKASFSCMALLMPVSNSCSPSFELKGMYRV
ncbi:hypothetical protein LguiB_008061 [Lonicera macranthoides]